MPQQSRRVHQRYQANLPVRIIAENGSLEATALNLSLGGMRARSQAPPAFGSTGRAVFRMPALEVDTEVEVTVRWVEGDTFGLQFGSLRARDVWALNQFFRDA